MKPFKCERCGYCCTLRVKLGFFEYLRLFLSGHRNFTEKDFKKRKCIKLINGKCFFLTEKNNKPFCVIYKCRPKACREYPGYKNGLCKDVNPSVKDYF